ncbi:oxidoreductase [Paractinoplanes durhamensis]|uniref:Oxidoreductase n=3 Tax=Paractinoplanes durhamensis TaxID=113563 RepID=A0ABQ3ZAT9_9ACTN|nr:oxidoreductase [Actinoplanes durhamensis]
MTVAFIGLGNMGGPMSARLIEAGHRVQGFDVAEPPRRALTEAGGIATTSIPEAIRDADVIILMLPNSDIVEATAEEIMAAVTSNAAPAAIRDAAHASPRDAAEANAGAIHEAGVRDRTGAIVVDMSSSEPLRTRALAAALKARGLTLVDAPVSGGVARARTGKLTIMTGGDSADLDRVEPVLSILGTTTRAGTVGSGHAVKALNNLMSATHLLVTSEAMLAGERFGLDPEVMLAIFNGSSGRSGSTENKWPNFVLPGTFDSGFGLRLMLKDMRIAVDLAAEVGTPDPLGQAAADLWSLAATALAPTADHTEIVNWLRKAPR